MPRRIASIGIATLLAGIMLALLAAATRQAAAAALPAPAAGNTYPGSGVCSTTLQACINGTAPGSAVTIQAGTYVTSVTLDRAVSLLGANSASTIIKALPGQRVITVTGASISLTTIISGLIFEDGHAIGGSCPTGCGGAVMITGSATPLLEKLVISNSVAQEFGGGLYANPGSPLTLQFVTILSNTSTNNSGGGIFAGDTLFLGHDFVMNNRAPFGAGGGVRATATVQTDGGIYQNNHSFNPGGAMRVTGNVNIAFGIFMSNTAGIVITNGNPINGGGLRADSNATLQFVQFTGNAASGSGGGAWVLGNASISGVLFQANQAITDAGGLGVAQNATLIGSDFLNNTAQHGNGGGLLVGGAVTGSAGLYQENQAGLRGGGAYITGTAVLTSPQFINNVAGFSLGGGLLAENSVVITGGTFLGNIAQNTGIAALASGLGPSVPRSPDAPSAGLPAGGGLFAEGAATLSNNLFESNLAAGNGLGGGAMFLSGSLTSTSSGDRFISNTAGTRGGGLQVDGPVTISADVFEGNLGGKSGGLELDGTGGVVANSLFADNVLSTSASDGAAAIRLTAIGPSFLLNDTLANRTAVTQTAVQATGSSSPVFVTDTLIAGYGVALSGTTIAEDHNLFFADATLTVGVTSGGHSFSADPLFVNAAGGDYHLTAASPARDAGVDVGLRVDFDGDPRPIGPGFDIGFDEFALRNLFLPLVIR